MKVERWGPGVHIDLPPMAMLTSPQVTGVTLTLEEAHALFEGLGETLGRMFGAHGAQSEAPTGSVGDGESVTRKGTVDRG